MIQTDVQERHGLGHLARLLTSMIVASVTALSYAVWLVWGYSAPDFEHVYDSWRGLGLSVSLAGLVVILGLRGLNFEALLVVPLSLTVAWSVEHAQRGPASDANLWPIGAGYWAVESFIGVLFVWWMAHFVRLRRA